MHLAVARVLAESLPSGQYDAGQSTLIGGEYEARTGFWVGAPCQLGITSDYDLDCDVDQDDFSAFQNCATGAALGPPAPGCEPFDFDDDLDIDQSDYGVFQRCLSGPGVPLDVACEGS